MQEDAQMANDEVNRIDSILNGGGVTEENSVRPEQTDQPVPWRQPVDVRALLNSEIVGPQLPAETADIDTAYETFMDRTLEIIVGVGHNFAGAREGLQQCIAFGEDLVAAGTVATTHATFLTEQFQAGRPASDMVGIEQAVSGLQHFSVSYETTVKAADNSQETAVGSTQKAFGSMERIAEDAQNVLSGLGSSIEAAKAVPGSRNFNRINEIENIATTAGETHIGLKALRAQIAVAGASGCLPKSEEVTEAIDEAVAMARRLQPEYNVDEALLLEARSQKLQLMLTDMLRKVRAYSGVEQNLIGRLVVFEEKVATMKPRR